MSNAKFEDTQLNPFGESDKCCKIAIENPATFVWGNCFNEKTYYTMQAWIKADSDKLINISVGNIATDVNVVDEWEQIIQTYNVQDLTSNSIYFNLPVGTYWFYNCKLEKGTRSTDYSTGDDDFFTEIHSAVEIASEKSRCIYSNVEPSGTEYDVGDTWFDTLHGYAISRWNGAEWVLSKLGTDAISELSITNALIADATISDAKISNIDAGKITTGYLVADRIANNFIKTRMIDTGAITATNIHSQTITADKLVLKSITSAQIASKTITGNEVQANSITAAELNVATLSAISANIGEVTAGIIKSPNYVYETSGLNIDLSSGNLFTPYVRLYGTGYSYIGGFNVDNNGLFCMDYRTSSLYYGAGIQKHDSTYNVINNNYVAFWAGTKGYGNGGTNAEFQVDYNGNITLNPLTPAGNCITINNDNSSSPDSYAAGIYQAKYNASGINISRSWNDGSKDFCSIGCDTISLSRVGQALSTVISRGSIGTHNVYGSSYLNICADETVQVRDTIDTTFKPISASAFNVQSSRRYKKNINDMSYDEAMQLLKYRVVDYDYINESDGIGCQGLIAEEVAEVNEYPVYKKSDGTIEGLDYSKFVPQLIKVVQIQSEEIKKLNQMVSQLS